MKERVIIYYLLYTKHISIICQLLCICYLIIVFILNIFIFKDILVTNIKSTNLFFLSINSSNNEIDDQLIKGALNNINYYFSLPEVKQYYGEIPVQLVDKNIHLTTQFYIDYICNQQFIYKFLLTLNWQHLLDTYNYNLENIYKEVIDQYCNYIQEAEKEYNKQHYSNIDIMQVINYIEPYITQNLTSFRKYQIKSQILLNYIDWPNYIKTHDFQKNNMLTLVKIFDKTISTISINEYCMLKYDTYMILNKLSKYISLSLSLDLKSTSNTVTNLNRLLDIISDNPENIHQTFNVNSLAVASTIPIESHIITPAIKELLLIENLQKTLPCLFTIYIEYFEGLSINIYFASMILLKINLFKY